MAEKLSNALWLAAAKAKQSPKLLGWYLDRYRERHGYSLEQLMAFLSGNLNSFPRLALCGCPDMEVTKFRHDVESIAKYASIDAARLAQLIREVVAFESLNDYIPQQAEGHRSSLIAARDKDNQNDEELQNDENDKKP